MGLAAFAGIVAQTVAPDPATGIAVGILLYLVSYYLARFTWYRDLGREGQTKVYTTGVGGFVLVFLFTWILFFTLRTVGYPV